MVTLAGKLVHSAVGSARLVPVRVRSRAVPRVIPRGTGGAKVGAWGLGAGGGWAGTATHHERRKARASSPVARWRERVIGVPHESGACRQVGGGWANGQQA